MESTDALFDTSPAAMAERFGARVRQLLREGRDVREIVRIASSYAFLHEPSLRLLNPDAWTVEQGGHRYLTPKGLAAIAKAAFEVVH